MENKKHILIIKACEYIENNLSEKITLAHLQITQGIQNELFNFYSKNISNSHRSNILKSRDY